MLTLTEIYDEVSRKADTQKVEITVAETKRVLACFFDVLEDKSAADVAEVMNRGFKQSAKRRR